MTSTLFPSSLHGDPNHPIIVILNGSPLPAEKAFSKVFLEELTQSYYVIIFSFPEVTPKDPSGYSWIELMHMFYSSLMVLNLLPEGMNEEESFKVNEQFRRLSDAEEMALKEVPTNLFSTSSQSIKDLFDGLSKKSSSIGEELAEEEKLEPREEGEEEEAFLTRSTDEPCLPPNPAFYPRHSKESLILDDMDVFSEEEKISFYPSSSTYFSQVPLLPINIFNEQDIKQKNEEILNGNGLSRVHSREDFLLLPSESTSQQPSQLPLPPSPPQPQNQQKKQEVLEPSPLSFRPFTEKDPSYLLPSPPIVISSADRIQAMIGQDYLANNFLLIYQNQFPSYFSKRLILLNYGIKNIYYPGDILFHLFWQWFCSFLFLCSLHDSSFSHLLVEKVFRIFIQLIVLISTIIEWIYLIYSIVMILSGKFPFLSHHHIERLRLQRKQFQHWKEELLSYEIKYLYLYYRYWQMKLFGASLSCLSSTLLLQPQFPENCYFFFLYESKKGIIQPFDQEFLNSFATRTYSAKEDLSIMSTKGTIGSVTSSSFISLASPFLFSSQRKEEEEKSEENFSSDDILSIFHPSLSFVTFQYPHRLVHKIRQFIDYTS